MKRFQHLILQILTLFGILLFVRFDTIAQNSITDQGTLLKSTDTSPKTIGLVEALKICKVKFGVDILYQNKMVDGLLVSNENFDSKENIEVVLSRILGSVGLKFKKIKTNLYAVVGEKKSPINKSSSAAEKTIFLTKESNNIVEKETGNNEEKNNQDNSTNKLLADIIISGTVKDEKGNPISGVTINVIGSKVFTTSDNNGKFKIKVKNSNSVLYFSHIGFKSIETQVGNSTNLSVTLISIATVLDDIVVIGYGTVKKKDLTGSVAKVNMADLNKAPVRSFDEALAGRIAGVQVFSNDGQPGSPITISIRGNNSLTQDNSPLYVIDGFPIENPNSNVLNPAEIESIEILKDASATAIYGARGANGVIIITTKKGKVGSPVIAFDTYYGTQQNAKKMDLMDPYNFIKYQSELNPTQTANTFFTNGKTLESYKNVKAVDWQGMVFRTAPIFNSSLSLSGGTASTKYSVSGSAFSQQGTVINSDFKRYQGRLVLDQTINQKLKVGLNVNYSNLIANGTFTSSNNGLTSTGLLYSIWGYRPISSDSANASLINNLFDTSLVLSNDYRGNPIININNTLNRKTTNAIVANLYADFTFTPELRLRVTGGINKSELRTDAFYNSNTVKGNVLSPQGINGPNGSVVYENTNNWVNENTLTYNKKLNENNQLNILGGATFQGTTNDSYGYAAINVPNDQLGLSDLGEGIPMSVSSSNSMNTLASFLSRLNYTYRSKYLFTFSWRADCSSKFAKGSRWSYFPSASFSWKLSSEKFARDLTWLSDAKLRTSYGVTGNNRVGDYAYQYTIATPISATYQFNHSPSRGAIPNFLGNPNLKWETTVQADLGLDASFLNQRIEITTDYYIKDTKNLLLNAALPTSMGFTSDYKNIGQVQNSGFELSISTINIREGSFTWSSSFNISFNQSKVIALTQNQESLLSTVKFDFNYASPLYVAKIAQPISQMIGYKWDGVYQLNDFNQFAGKYVLKDNVPNNGNARNTIQPGDIKYRDINKDGVVNTNDVTVIGNPYPKHLGGLTNTFRYKGFDVNIFFQWSYGNDIVNLNRLIFDGNQLNSTNLNQFASNENRWSITNQNTTVYRTHGGGPIGTYSSRVIEDGSYLRLKTIQLGYNLPVSSLKKVAIKTLRVYASGQNLVTWTKYSGLDPEVSSYQSTLTPGADYSAYPRSRTMTIGVNVTF